MICFIIFALLVCLIYHFILNIFDELIKLVSRLFIVYESIVKTIKFFKYLFS